MEFYKSQKIITLTLFLFYFVGITYSQGDLYVFNHKGNVNIIKDKDSIQVYKGCLIKENQELVLDSNSSVIYINKDGLNQKISKKGRYSYSSLTEFKNNEEQPSFMKAYFSYLWEEFTNLKRETRTKSGVVYRGDEEVLMLYPYNNSSLYSDFITFNWQRIKDKKKNYYVVIKHADSIKYSLIGTKNNQIELKVDGILLKKNTSYQWTITETKFFNIEKLNFHTFTIPGQEEYAKLKNDSQKIENYLLKLGVNQDNIDKILCQDFKICLQ